MLDNIFEVAVSDAIKIKEIYDLASSTQFHKINGTDVFEVIDIFDEDHHLEFTCECTRSGGYFRISTMPTWITNRHSEFSIIDHKNGKSTHTILSFDEYQNGMYDQLMFLYDEFTIYHIIFFSKIRSLLSEPVLMRIVLPNCLELYKEKYESSQSK